MKRIIALVMAVLIMCLSFAGCGKIDPAKDVENVKKNEKLIVGITDFAPMDYKENGEWVQKPYYAIDDPLPYGHGEKSVYMVSGYMKLTRDEAFAIRYHMGFAGAESVNAISNIGKSFEMFPISFALSVADMEATYYVEGTPG